MRLDRVRVHFLYGFLLSIHKEFDDFVSSLSVAPWGSEVRKTKYWTSGVRPLLNLRRDEAIMTAPTQSVRFHVPDIAPQPLPISVSEQTRVSRSGQGVCRITLDCDSIGGEPMTVPQAISLASLDGSYASDHATVDCDGTLLPSPHFLFLRFMRAMIRLCAVANGQEVPPFVAQNSLSTLRSPLKEWVKASPQADVEWVDMVTDDIIGFDDECLGQYPYVLTEVEVGNHAKPLEVLFGNSTERRDEITRNLAALLLRHKGIEHLSSAECEEQGGPAQNLSPSRELFINIHQRSCLVVWEAVAGGAYRKTAPDGTPGLGAQTLASVIDAVELLRMRWHASVILAAFADARLWSYRQVCRAPTTTEGAFPEQDQWLDAISALRRDILATIEDPLTYRRSTSTAFDVYEKGLALFQILALDRSLIRRLDALEAEYRDLRERRRIADLKTAYQIWRRNGGEQH